MGLEFSRKDDGLPRSLREQRRAAQGLMTSRWRSEAQPLHTERVLPLLAIYPRPTAATPQSWPKSTMLGQHYGFRAQLIKAIAFVLARRGRNYGVSIPKHGKIAPRLTRYIPSRAWERPTRSRLDTVSQIAAMIECQVSGTMAL